MRINPFEKYYNILNTGNSAYKFANRPDFPVLIDIELTNLCNFTCRMCETGMGTSIRTKGMMSKETFLKILADASQKNIRPALRFIRWGEPTLHPQFFEYLQTAKEAGFMVHFNTNGYTMTDELMNNIVKLQIDSVKFSFQGADAESYAEMRGIDFFDALFKKIETLIAIRANALLPYIQVSTTLTDETDDKITYFKTKAQIADYYNIGKTNLARVNEKRLKHFDDVQKHKSLRKREHYEAQTGKKSCNEIFAKLSVNWNGDVTGCCADNNNEMILGNIHRNTLDEIFHSEKIILLQHELASNNFSINTLCRKCVERY
jgi:radical SAM protein with 4Fe4S-binding SPASM domain